jgi:hypothetical protein
LDQVNIAGYPVSSLTGYPAGQSGIRLDTGYKKGHIIRPAGYPVHHYLKSRYGKLMVKHSFFMK